MGFYIRKGFNFGPIRLNLSRSGLGASFGVPGARIGVGPRGSYVHLGRGGLYYRQSLSSSSQSRSGSPRVISTPRQGDTGLQEIASESAAKIVDGSSSELLAELNRVQQRWDSFPIIAGLGGVATLWLLLGYDGWWWILSLISFGLVKLQNREYVAVNAQVWGTSGDHDWCLFAQGKDGKISCWHEQEGNLDNYLRTSLQPDESTKVGWSIDGRNGQVFIEDYVEAHGDANCCPSRGKIQVELSPREGALYWSKVTRTADLDQSVKVASDTYGLDPDLLSSVLNAGTETNASPISPQKAAEHLREMLERYNFDLVKALAAYKVGPESVDQYSGVPPQAEVREFVARVVRDYNRRKSNEEAHANKH